MSTSFDDLLKKGKSKVEGINSKPESLLEDYIFDIMELAHKINALYGHDKAHHLHLEGIKCSKCNLTSFKLNVRDPKDPKRTLKYYRKGWKNIGKQKYRCPEC